jgi:hypothetical protein
VKFHDIERDEKIYLLKQDNNFRDHGLEVKFSAGARSNHPSLKYLFGAPAGKYGGAENLHYVSSVRSSEVKNAWNYNSTLLYVHILLSA